MILSELPMAERILINMIFELENKMRQVVPVKRVRLLLIF